MDMKKREKEKSEARDLERKTKAVENSLQASTRKRKVRASPV
jgi:hypothetical protein